MCNDSFNQRLAPLNKIHLKDIQSMYPKQKDFSEKLFSILTRDLTPQVNLLVAFVVLKDFYEKGKKGIFSNFGNILYVPLSIVAKTGSHEWTRFRPGPVSELHTSFLSFMMAQPNRKALNALLGESNLSFAQAHCCGILFGNPSDIESFQRSDLFKSRNEMRSYAEAMAMPVKDIPFSDIPSLNSDLGSTELEFYLKYDEVFDNMTYQEPESFLDKSQDKLWQSIVVVPEQLQVA